MADKFLFPKLPHGADPDTVRATLEQLLEFLRSPDFQYYSGRREGILMRIGNIAAGNYTEFEADGSMFMHGDATMINDVPIPLASVRLPAANAPAWIAYKGTQVLAFDGTSTDTIYFTVKVPHGYKEGSDYLLHVHWVAEDNTTGNVKWQFTYSFANADATFPAPTSVTGVVATPEVADKHVHTDVATIDGTGQKLSSVILCALSRLGGDAEDTYAQDVYFLEADFHVELNSIGGRTGDEK